MWSVPAALGSTPSPVPVVARMSSQDTSQGHFPLRHEETNPGAEPPIPILAGEPGPPQTPARPRPAPWRVSSVSPLADSPLPAVSSRPASFFPEVERPALGCPGAGPEPQKSRALPTLSKRAPRRICPSPAPAGPGLPGGRAASAREWTQSQRVWDGSFIAWTGLAYVHFCFLLLCVVHPEIVFNLPIRQLCPRDSVYQGTFTRVFFPVLCT